MNTFDPQNLFAPRMKAVPTSFIREILKVTLRPEIISFAGGLPNPKFFPVDAVKAAADKVLTTDGRAALQYSTSEGYQPLREYLAERYRRTQGLEISPDEIMIVSGSQQAIDLLGKVFISKGDPIAIEKPGYLGAIQSFSVYEPTFRAVTLTPNGVDVDELAKVYDRHHPKLFSAIPNFQNPSGLSYDAATRERVGELICKHETVIVEDDPYGELRFRGKRLPSLKQYAGDRAILMGSFSKIVAPGLRLGWIVASKPILEKLVIVKQAADLHTNFFTQRVVHRYLCDNDLDAHIAKICEAYGNQCDAMLAAIKEFFPSDVKVTRPDGGMFLWATLPEGFSSMDLFDRSIKQNVAFVPGTPFYVDGGGANTMRLNYSNADAETLREGVRRMGAIMSEFLVPAS